MQETSAEGSMVNKSNTLLSVPVLHLVSAGSIYERKMLRSLDASFVCADSTKMRYDRKTTEKKFGKRSPSNSEVVKVTNWRRSLRVSGSRNNVQVVLESSYT